MFALFVGHSLLFYSGINPLLHDMATTVPYSESYRKLRDFQRKVWCGLLPAAAPVFLDGHP
jgi:hypothetical protein